MGFFGPFKFKTKSGKVFFLHMKDTGKVKLYYFSKEQQGCLNDLPHGYEVAVNDKTELPFLRKKVSAPKKTKEEQTQQSPAQNEGTQV
jgi:hypothetical protein